MNLCSSDSSEKPTSPASAQKKAMTYTYNPSKIEAMALINNYSVSIGLNQFK